MSTHFKGPLIVTETGSSIPGVVSSGAVTTLNVGSGTTLTFIKKGTVSVTVSALAAAAEEQYSLSIADAAVGDIIIMNPPAAAAETGLAQILCYVASAGSVGLRVSNVNAAAALTGSTSNWSYCLIRS